MKELIFSCQDGLPQAATPCPAPYGDIDRILVSKRLIPAAGNTPSATEFDAAYTAGHLIILNGFTNAHRIKLSEVEVENIHLGTDIHDVKYRIEGKLKRFNESIARLCEIIDRLSMVYVYYITDNYYCFGEYQCEPRMNLIEINQMNFINFTFDYFDIGIDYSNYDSDYENLPGISTYLLSEDGDTLLTEDGTPIFAF